MLGLQGESWVADVVGTRQYRLDITTSEPWVVLLAVILLCYSTVLIYRSAQFIRLVF